MAYSSEKYSKTYIFKLLFFCGVLLALFICVFLLSIRLGFFRTEPQIVRTFSDTNEDFVIVLDAGHGGVDTGASGIVGKYESALCLEVTQKVCAYLNMHSYSVRLTRTDDNLLSSSNTSLSRKQSDLAGRVEITESVDDPIFISIHMNTYPLESCKGTQIFYSPNNSKSKSLADIISNNIKSILQPDNKRLNKQAGSNIYVLHKLKAPAVLIECGFITNLDEATKLNDEEYQNKLAAIIAESIIEFIENSNGEIYG